MLKNREELKEYYESLKSKYEGYVQMSDSHFKSEHVWDSKQNLPTWDTLHNKVNYILEMALFDGEKSILIRQHNADFLVIDEQITKAQIQEADSFYTVTNGSYQMKIAQIWKEEKSEFCKGWNVLEPKYLMFVGFDNKELYDGSR